MSTAVPTTVLISGSGSNLQAMIDGERSGKLNIRIVRVISNRIKAFGLDRARQADIPTRHLSLPKCRQAVQEELNPTQDGNVTSGQDRNSELQRPRQPSEDEIKTIARQRFDGQLADAILEDCPRLVVCAGFMHILSAEFLRPMAQAGVEVINLHPALPGEFNGIQAIERAHSRWLTDLVEFKAGRISDHDRFKRTGVMVHRVVLEVDMGEPVLMREIPFVEGEDEDISVFEKKLHAVEWQVIVEAVDRVATRISSLP